VRNIIPVAAGVILYKEVITATQMFGYCISFIAFGVYTYIKMPKQVNPR
jgi:hypothetical protein